MAVRADGTVYRWRDQSNKIKVQKINGIENALHVFQIDYDKYLVLLQDKSLLYIEGSNISPIRSVTDVLDYKLYQVLTNDGCVYQLNAEADNSILKYKPESPREEAISIGQCSQGTVIQTRDGESYIVRETCSESEIQDDSTEYLIRFDGVALTKDEVLVEPEIYNTVYTNGELIITLEGNIYQMLSIYYKNSETYNWDQDYKADRVLIKVDPECLNLQYLVDHNKYKMKEAYIPDEIFDASLAYLIMAGQ